MSEHRFKVLERWARFEQQVAEAAQNGYTSEDTRYVLAMNLTPRAEEALAEPAEVAEAVEKLQAEVVTLNQRMTRVWHQEAAMQERITVLETDNARLRAELQRVALVAEGCHKALQATPEVCPVCQGSGSGAEDPDAILGGEHQVCPVCQGLGRRETLGSVTARLEALERLMRNQEGAEANHDDRRCKQEARIAALEAQNTRLWEQVEKQDATIDRVVRLGAQLEVQVKTLQAYCDDLTGWKPCITEDVENLESAYSSLRAELQRVGMVAEACHQVLQATPPVCEICEGTGSRPELVGENQVCAACQGSGRQEGRGQV